VATVFRNLIIIQATISDNNLYMHLYYFLSTLSFVDMYIISTTVPHMLVSIQMQIEAITYEGCITQIYCFELFACLDNFFLVVIEYDNFVAICHPCSCYNMSHQLCALLCPGSQMP
jgi:olfactory receptor